MRGGLLVGDSPVCPRPRGSGQPRGHVAHGLGRTPAGSPGASVVAPPAGVSQAGWSSPCPARCPEGDLGERPNPNPGGTEPGSHQDPHTCPTCPLPRGSPSSPRLSRQVWAQTLSFGRPTQRHLPFPGPPGSPRSGGTQPNPTFGGASSFLAVFSPARRPRSRRGRRVPAGSPGHGAAPAAAQHRGLSLSHRAAGDRTPSARPTPMCPPARAGTGLVALRATPRWRRGQRGAGCGSGARCGAGGSPRWVLGCRGPRARRGWAVPSRAVPASPASPLLPKHARPEKAVPAGSGRPGPGATRARDSLARGPAASAGSRTPSPAGMPGGCSPAQEPPTMDGAGRAPQPSPLNNRVLSRRGQRIPARGPRSGPAALGVPTQPPAIPGPRRGHGATPIPVVPRAGPGGGAGAALPGWEPGEPRCRKPIGSCWEQPR